MNDLYPVPSLDTLKAQKEMILKRIYDHHLRHWCGSEGNVFFISDTYPGCWAEHLYDGIAWANYMPAEHDVSKHHIDLFLDRQTEEGQIPCYVWANEIGYGQVQECVSIGSVCLEAIAQNPDDPAFLRKCYDAVSKWVNWFYEKRMTLGCGLVEMFCGYDTGHDDSARLGGYTNGAYHLDGIKYRGNRKIDGKTVNAGILVDDCAVLPILAPDMNACFFGNHMALAEMADLLGLATEAEVWRYKANIVREKMTEYLWDEDDRFFYDVDRNGNKRKIRSISITNVLSEGVLDKATAEAVYKRYIKNENEFWTPFPLPAVSSSDPGWIQNKPGNSWGFYSQGLTALRTMRWMPKMGHTDDMEELMRRWVSAWSRSQTTLFGQELHPITGEPSVCSQWYSSCMLYFLHAIRRLYGV